MTIDRSRRRRAVVATLLALLVVPAFAGSSLGAGKSNIPDVREATRKYKDINAAIADQYVLFYQCTEQPGVGTMGQHFVKGSLVEDPAIDALHPEVLVYAPKRNGDWKLVAVEYVTLAPLWVEAFPGQWPTVLGQDLAFWVLSTPENIANLDAGRRDSAFWGGVRDVYVSEEAGRAWESCSRLPIRPSSATSPRRGRSCGRLRWT